MKKYLLILSALMLTWIGAKAQITSGGSYMIVNTETEQFLYGSYNWGSRASLGSKPVFFTITSVSGNTYHLADTQWTGDHYLYLTTDNQYYCDGSTSSNYTLTIEGNDNDGYTISYNGYYVYAEQGKNNYVTSTTNSSQASHFKFVSLDDVVASMEGASSASPVDVTALIDDANFKPGGNGLTATNSWTNSGVTIGNYSNTATQACCAEAYEQTSYSVSQSITLPKKGIYILSAQGFYRNGYSGTDSHSITAQMFAGDQTVSLNARTTTANTMAAAWDVFLQGSEPIAPITIDAENDETSVNIGFSGSLTSSETGDWAIFGELTLMYYGETLTYAIGEPECSVTTVAPGGTVSITFPNCATPNNTQTPVLNTSAGSITVNSTEVAATLTYSGTTATVTFTVPETIARGTTVTVVVPQGLVEWSEQSVSSPATETTFYLTTPLIEDQLGVYLFNLGENEFLSRGHNYDDSNGTAADVDVYGLPVDITANADGKYNIRYIDSNLYLGGMYWATANEALADAASFTIVADGTNSDGKPIYRFRNGSSNSSVTGDLYVNNGTSHGPLGLNDDDEGINSTADRQWVIYSKEERDALKAANVLAAKLATATALDPSFSGTTESDFNTFIGNLNSEVCTNMVGGASLATADDLASWTEVDYSTEGTGFTAGDGVIETYEDVDDLTQTITGLEEGIYKVTLQGFNRMGAASYILTNLKDYDISLATLGANDDEINLKTWASDRGQMSGAQSSDTYPNNTGEAAACFTAGLYNNELYTYVSNGSLTITIACPDFLGADWVIFTNLTLTRYYTDDIYTNDVTWELANPSFEVDNVAYLGEDATRSTTDDGNSTHTGGAYTIENGLTGWTLEAPTSTTDDRAIADLLTADCKRTDNGYGAPGTPSGGDQMLYLRCAWETNTGSVTQTVSLPEGSYKLTVDSKCVTTGSGHSATLVVGDDKSVTLPTHSAYNGDDLDWDTSSLKFAVGSGGEDVTIGVKATFADVASGLSVALDNFKLYSAAEIEETIKWTMTDAGWGTLILPFDASIPSGLTAYSCDGTTTDEETETTTVNLTEVNAGITANTPYIVSGTASTYSFEGVPTNEKEIYTDGLLTGTLVDLAVATGAAFATDGTQYLLQHHDQEDDSAAFYPIVATESAGATLDAYHCYLTYSEASPTRLVIGFAGSDGEATGIVAVEGAEAEGNGAIYDLSGRKVSKAVKGVYIQNGKKVLVK